MGMIDVFPTLANMFGINASRMLGRDIFSANSNKVVFPNGDWLDENVIYFSSDMEFKIIGQDLIDLFVAECRRSDADAECTDRVFEYAPDKHYKEGPRRLLQDYVRERTRAAAKVLDISSLVLEYDLHRPTDGNNH